MDKLIVQHPELTKLYPAIDGIAKDRREGHYAEDPIRSDILEILSFDQAKFDAWHKNRYEAIKKHLNEWTVMGDVPDPRYGGENSKFTVGRSNSVPRGIIDALGDELRYLGLIKYIREERLFLLKMREACYKNGQAEIRNEECTRRGDVDSIWFVNKDKASFLQIILKWTAEAKGNFISVDKVELNYEGKKYDKFVCEFPLTADMVISASKCNDSRLIVGFPPLNTKIILYPVGDNRLNPDLI